MAISPEWTELLRQELTQRRQEGCDTDGLGERVEAALGGEDESVLPGLFEEVEALEPAASFPFVEPSTLEAIRAEGPDGPRRMDVKLDDDALFDRIHGAWLGRAAGCLLGKPVEGWPKANIDRYLEKAGALPLDDYFPLTDDHPGKEWPAIKSCTRGNIAFMERDDDMDYPVLGLHLVESKGAEFTSLSMARTWMSRMPFYLLYTAERAAYKNFVNDIWPPDSAAHRNPFREWIGAQIRADIFGYVTPGLPELGAELAFRDAAISHVKNGIYGEMFIAAILSAVFATDDMDEAIRAGLSEIPGNCRLAEAVNNTMAWCGETDDWEKVWERINEHYGHYHPVHTINNAALVVMGLLYGADDYEKGIVVSVRGGWDTDCNGATVGSILGARLGAKALPEKWIGVLNNRLISAVRGYGDSSFTDLAKRTHAVAKGIVAQA